MSAIVTASGLVHIYKAGPLEVVALQGLELEVAEGEMLAIVGRSGSGKTTLMNVLAAADRPNAGSLSVAGYDVLQLSRKQRDRYRRAVIGYAWQQPTLSLTQEISAVANLQLPLLMSGRSWAHRREMAERLVELLGLAARRDHLPTQLSSGEQHRLALGIAMANEPRLLLADEPTAGLDRATAESVLRILRRAQIDLGLTVVTVSHDPVVAQYADRSVQICDGRISQERRRADQEVAVIDSAGRLQIPGPLLDAASLGARARLRVVDAGLLLEPVDSASD
ncbi:MAG: ABC transporter ATP-binding protein [Candidatus Dormibacteraeota bacterium]|uniref:ABC transporter ATP-binding protein n=1 Tax=Candidatus Dormiibacter inghamiae TaxID=3127013 RepID=A0A934N784_9BACT|nr:ABC transporter ATP-binding protein [Candidatus Dormibacteraeota bacterium]MBJ7606552.1 ABC transporter ATP-binding protein [Candidatus Dormibacteraeota bacterium]